MSQLFYAVAVLACPVGMGAMMWLMARGQRGGATAEDEARRAELRELRAEIDRLRDSSPADSTKR